MAGYCRLAVLPEAASIRRLGQIIFLLCFAVVSIPALSAELFTSYRLLGVSYPSLQAAENALWNLPYFGYAYYTYQSTSADGRVRTYYHPPTSEYFVDPMLVFSSTPGIACDNGPLFDQFGNDWCSNVHSGQCCDSEANWWAAVQNAFPGIDCPPIKTGETPWEQTSMSGITYPVAPGEIIMLSARFKKSVHTAFPSGNSSLCGRTEEFTLRAISPGHCPAGYQYFETTGPDTGICRMLSLPQNIFREGAQTAEPDSNQCSVGNPCYPASGDKTLSENDFSSDTLHLTRYYHSLQIYPDYAAIGKGWSHSYSGRIIIDGNVTKMIDGKGDAERFTCVDSPACTTYRSQSESGHILRPVTGGWEVYLNSGELRHFDRSGKLILITNRSSRSPRIAITYTAEDRVSEVIDQRGRALRFSYNDNGLVDAVTMPNEQQIHYVYAPPAGDATNNPRYNLVKVIYQDSTERIYHYEDTDGQGLPRYGNLLTGITDENGNRFATYRYDYAARVISSEHAGGAGHIDLHYTTHPGENLNWSITEVTMPLGEVASYDVEPGPFRKVTGITDTRGSAAHTYDSETNWVVSRQDRNGNLTTYQYDGLHQVRRTEAVGTPSERVVEADWDNTINRVSELREPGKTTTFTYNSRGQVLTRTETDNATHASRTWAQSFFEIPSLAPLIGQLRSTDGPRTDISDVTAYEYYTSDHANGDYLTGDLKSIVSPIGQRTDYLKYDGNGRVLEVRDANGVLIALTYHVRGWVRSHTIDGKSTTFDYDSAGNLTRVTQADGSFFAYEYDAANRLIAIADNFGNRVEYLLDAEGNRITEKSYDDSGELRRQLAREYDQLGRLTAILDGNSDATRYGYDNVGNRTRSVDANGNVTAYEYDGLQRLVKAIDPRTGQTVMDYDARDNLIGVTDPSGGSTQYIYNGLDSQLELDSPDTGDTSYEYDAAGNRTQAIDARGVLTRYDYDALNRLTDIRYPDSDLDLDVHFSYDEGRYGKGHLARMSDAVGRVDYQYDSRGNLVAETRSIGTTEYTTQYSYNDADRLTGMTYPSGMSVNYARDDAGRVIAVFQTVAGVTKSIISDVQYEPFGPATRFRYGNGLTYDAALDQDFELVRLQSGSGIDWLLAYDPVGNLLAIDDQLDASHDQIFSYDELNRLDVAVGKYGREEFDYDANGNRLRTLNGGLAEDRYSYEPRSNRLAEQGGWTISRDAAGNREEKLDSAGFGQHYAYADNNRLSRIDVSVGSGETLGAEYAYDGRGQRVSKTVDGDATQFVYGTAGELLGEYQGEGHPLAEYIYLNGQVVAMLGSQARSLPATPVEIVMDNDDPGTSSTGSWKLKTNKKAYGNSYRSGNKADTYRWAPPAIAGTYEIYAWLGSSKKKPKGVIYTVSHNGFNDIVATKETKSTGSWCLLGTFEFDGSGEEYVELSSENGKKLIADAMRFSQVDAPDENTVYTTGTFFVHTDHLGTPRQVTDEFQTVIWRWDSPPFGNSFPEEDPDGDGAILTLNLRFPGQYYDAESGLNYNYFRYFDPVAGRYITSDPLGQYPPLVENEVNPIDTYVYVNSNPVTLIDPLGLAPQKPGCDLFPDFNTCAITCCNAHDRCYERNGCNMFSWLYTAGVLSHYLSACARCNEQAVLCIAKAAISCNECTGK